MDQPKKVNYDKSRWAPGEWQSEPDRVDFRHTGLPCLLLRNRLGIWCGYAGVHTGHQDFGKDRVDADAHGGLTYASECAGSVCHVPEPGELAVWWFGFDTGHAGDWAPGLNVDFGGNTYRNLAYVRRETKKLAEQLAAREKR